MTETTTESPQQPELLSDVVSTMVTLEQTLSQLQSLRASLLSTAYRIAEENPEIEDVRSREMAHRAVATELGAALRMSDRTVERQMGDAFVMRRDFPATTAAFERGDISPAHVRVITEAGAEITDAARRTAFERMVLEKAMEESPNRLRPFAKRLSERFREVSFQQRNDEARKKRSVWVRDLEDGQSELGVSGPSAIVHGIFERISQMGFAVKTENDKAAKDARAKDREAAQGDRVKDDGAAQEDQAAQADQYAQGDPDDGSEVDDRSLGEIRADLIADLLLTGIPSGHDTSTDCWGAFRVSSR